MSGEPAKLVRLAGTLLSRGGTLQSGQAAGPIDDARLTSALEAAVAARGATGGTGAPETAVAARTIVDHAKQAIAAVAAGGSASNLSDLQYASLEAVVHVIGRPAVRYRNGKVQAPPSELGENERWVVIISHARSAINRVSAAVGRVELAGLGPAGFLGTAWRVGADFVITNRHVARHLVASPAEPVSRWALAQGRNAVVDFAATDDAVGAATFPVVAMEQCAPEDLVDVAILRIGHGQVPMPPELPLDMSETAVVSELEVYVVGHPYRPVSSAVTAAVFGAADGLKRWAPGVVTAVSAGSCAIEHDCSTLGGNSGSCVFTMQTHRAVAIHVGGRGVNETTSRGEANVAVAFGRMGSHPLLALLRAPGSD